MLDFIFNRKFLKLKKEIVRQINYWYEQEQLYLEMRKDISDHKGEVGRSVDDGIIKYRAKRHVLEDLLKSMTRKK